MKKTNTENPKCNANKFPIHNHRMDLKRWAGWVTECVLIVQKLCFLMEILKRFWKLANRKEHFKWRLELRKSPLGASLMSIGCCFHMNNGYGRDSILSFATQVDCILENALALPFRAYSVHYFHQVFLPSREKCMNTKIWFNICFER